MFNVKRKTAKLTPLPKPETEKEVEIPNSQCVADEILVIVGTPPLTPGSENASTDEPSADSAEDPVTVEEIIREEDSKDDSKEENSIKASSKEEAFKNDAAKEADEATSRDEACKDANKDDAIKDEVAQEPARDDEANEHNPMDPERVYVGRLPEDIKDYYENIQGNGFNIYCAWALFWTIALSGGILAYYLSIHQYLVLARLSSGGLSKDNLQLIPREKWDDSGYVLAKPSSYVALQVVVVQTDTEACDSYATCTKLLNAMKVREQKRQEGIFMYNFLLATDGCIYELLGWQKPSPLFPDAHTMVVAFIGDYETENPSTMQLTQFQALLDASQELQYLSDEFSIIGRKQTVLPSKLFVYLSFFEKWDKENSDSDDKEYDEVEFDELPMFL